MEKKKILIWTIVLSIVMLVPIPFVGEKILKDADGMSFMLLAYLVIDPLFFIGTGIFSGRDIKNRWFVPIIPAFVFIVNHWILANGAFAAFGLIYLFFSFSTWPIMVGLANGRARAARMLEEEKKNSENKKDLES